MGRITGLDICRLWVRTLKTTVQTTAKSISWGSHSQGKLEKVGEFESSWNGQGTLLFGKVGENEKLVPPDVRFSC